MPLILNGSTGISGTDGSAATPAVQGTDTNTGMFFPAADQIAFAEGGTEVMRLDASGNVGIGTSSPSERLQVNAQDGARLGASGAVSFLRLGSAFAGESTSQISYDRSTGATSFSQGNTGSAPNERMRIDASGNVGIGTSAPGNKLDIVSAGSSQIRVKDGVNAAAYYDFGRDGTDGFFGFSGAQTTFSGYKWSVNAGTEVMRITNAGNVGIGTIATGHRLVVAGNTTSDAYLLRASGSAPSADAAIYRPADNTLGFVTGSNERARITSGGDLLLGTASTFGGSTGGLQVQNGGEQIRIKHNSNANYWRFVADNNNTVYIVNQTTTGVFIANGGSSWSGLSDERAKDIIEPIQDAASKVSQLRAVIGKYKVDEEGKRRSFLIAQDVQAVLPEAISIADPETGYLGLSYTDVVPLLTAALQEALTEIASLKARVAVLEAR